WASDTRSLIPDSWSGGTAGSDTLGDELAHVAGVARRAEQIALHLRAPFRPHVVELRRRLDTLRGGDDAETAPETCHRLDDGGAVCLLRQVANERTVDLDLVEREAAQIAERRITGTEVVHGDADSEATQLMQGRKRRLAVLQQHRLGDLELEAIC